MFNILKENSDIDWHLAQSKSSESCLQNSLKKKFKKNAYNKTIKAQV